MKVLAKCFANILKLANIGVILAKKSLLLKKSFCEKLIVQKKSEEKLAFEALNYKIWQ